jgi:hypothetical protein
MNERGGEAEKLGGVICDFGPEGKLGFGLDHDSVIPWTLL